MDNKEIKKCFRQPMEIEGWKWAIENRVAPWVEERNKGYWALVLFVSKRRGVLRNDMGRERFGELLLSLCPTVFDSSDTSKSLKYNMDKFEYNNLFDRFDRLPDTHPLRIYAAELDAMFDNPQCQTEKPVPVVYTIEQRIEEYLHKYIDTLKYARVITRPTYGNYTSTFSVEQYVTKEFMDKGQASQIVVFECVDGIVDGDKVATLAGKFMGNHFKIYIASSKGFSNHTLSVAKERYVGLIRVNPSIIVNEHNFVLPRENSSFSLVRSCLRMFHGETEQTLPFVVRDGRHVGSSLVTELSFYGIAVKPNAIFSAPTLSDVEIESIAYRLIKDDIETYVRLLRSADWHSNKVPVCRINLDKVLKLRGLKVVYSSKNMKGKMATIDMRQRVVTLNSNCEKYEPRERFSRSHEIGHDVLHRHLENNFDETTSTMDIDIKEQQWMERQANVFATYLLMPEQVVRLLYQIYWRKEFHQDTVLPLTYSSHQPQLGQYQRVVGPISRKMGVSLEAMTYRLQKLGLLTL